MTETNCTIAEAVDRIGKVSVYPRFDLQGKSNKLDSLWVAYEKARAAAGIPEHEGFHSIPRGAHCPEVFGLLCTVTDMAKHGAICFSEREYEIANRALEDPKFKAFLIERRALEKAITRFLNTKI